MTNGSLLGSGLTPAPPKRGIRSWFRRGGLTSVLFALPVILVFAYFSWGPIARGLAMSWQKTNLVEPATLGRVVELRVRAPESRARSGALNTIWFVVLALIIGFPLPLFLAVFISELRGTKPLYSVLAYLPVVIPPVVAILLWKVFYDPSSTGVFNTMLGWVGIGPLPFLNSPATAMPSLVLESTWASAGSTVIIYLAAMASVRGELYEAAELDGAGIWAQGVEHHDPPAARRHPDRAAAAGHRHDPGLRRTVPVHRGRPEQRHNDDPADDLQLRVHLRRLRSGERPQHVARSRSRRRLGALLPGDPSLERRMSRRVVRAAAVSDADRGIISISDRRRPSVRIGLSAVQVLILIGLVVAGLGPLVWLMKSAISTTQDILRDPFGFFPSGVVLWENIPIAWEKARIGMFLGNTAIIAIGSTIITLFVCLTAAYVLSVLRPKWGPVLNGAIMATLFIPGVIALVPLYLTVLDLPLLGVSLVNNYLALWLPAGANAFLILVVRALLRHDPRELFEAARIDGAGPVRVFLLIVLPLLASDHRRRRAADLHGVVEGLSLAALRAARADPAADLGSAAKIADTTPLNVQIAALFLALLVPVTLFVAFQRQFLAGVGMAGGTKG